MASKKKGLLRKFIEWCYANDGSSRTTEVPKDKNKLKKAQEECREKIRQINDRLFDLAEEKKDIERVIARLIQEYEQASANIKSGYKRQIMVLKKDLDEKKERELILETKLQQQTLLLNKLKVNEEISDLEDQSDTIDTLIVDNKIKLEEFKKNQERFDELERTEYRGRDKKDDENNEDQNDAEADFQKFINEFSNKNSAEDEEIASVKKNTEIQEEN